MIYPAGPSLSAINAFQKKLNVSANNVANVQTDGFKKSRVTFSEEANGGVAAKVDQIDTPGITKETIRNDGIEQTESSNVDLAEEIPELMVARSGYGANLKTLRSQNDMLGTLLDIMG